MPNIDDSEYAWRDFCPLCGSRFLAKSPNGLCKLILRHAKRWCSLHFIALPEAIHDNAFGARKPTRTWRE